MKDVSSWFLTNRSLFLLPALSKMNVEIEFVLEISMDFQYTVWGYIPEEK
jgi:hypothetical protein